MNRLVIFGLGACLALSAVSNDAFGWGAVTGPRGGAAYRGPMGGAAVRGPYGGGAVRGPYGGTAVRGPYGAGAVRGPYGGVAVGGPVAVYRPWVARPYYGAVIAGVTVGALVAATAPPPPPSPELCWYWGNSAKTQGYWDYCY